MTRFATQCLTALLAVTLAVTLAGSPAAAATTNQAAAAYSTDTSPDASETPATSPDPDTSDSDPDAMDENNPYAAEVAVVEPGDDAPDDASDDAREPKPTPRELLATCKAKADVCKFHPSDPPRNFLSDARRATPIVSNCFKHADNSFTKTAERGVSSSNTFGVAITGSVGFQEVFEASIQLSFQHTWEVHRTFSEQHKVAPEFGYRSWAVMAVPKQTVHGMYELHFGNRFYGHYVWYLKHYVETGPRPGASGNDSRVFEQGDKMTDRQFKQCKKVGHNG